MYNTFSLWRTLRLSSFQIGSAMGEIITAAIWNRIMIADLGLPAWPVGLLLALQYFLMPISLWAGHRSDTTMLWGTRRIAYIWSGRGLMVIALPLLGFSIRFFESGNAIGGWLLSTLCFLLFGVGKLLSGSVYLALVKESAPPQRQGLAIGIVETVLIAFFPIVAITFGRWMEVYDAAVFWQMVLATTIMAAFFWWFAIHNAERGTVPLQTQTNPIDFMAKFKTIWQNDTVRRFFLFLFVATFAAWMQDNILEPFGADVFALEAGDTTRFTGYWGGATIITLLILFRLWRQRRPENQAGATKLGLNIMGLGMALLGVTAVIEQRSLIIPVLLIFGTGFGIYTFGGLSLMVAMSPKKDAGAYLGLWTISILVSKGLGTFVGGLLRDIFLSFWSVGWGYGVIFVLAALGLISATLVLNYLDIGRFVQEIEAEARSTQPQIVSAD